jgi:ribonuclease-3
MPKNIFGDRYKTLIDAIGIQFHDLELLDLAFVHKSYLNEHRKLKNDHNERLEFLGDAVLELIVTEHLYKKYPKEGEGVLTNWRSALVKGKHLAEVAIELELGIFLYLSRGEERSGGRKKNYILANTLEALIGAIYLDQGYEVTQKFSEQQILTRLDQILEKGQHIDAKSRFQEIAQELIGMTPDYKFLSETGPDHEKIFTMGLFLGQEKIAEGQGSSKQKAEQEAAFAGLKAKQWENVKLSTD